MSSKGELHIQGIFVAADRGYGLLNLLPSFLRKGMRGVMIMSEHLSKCHPFTVKSHFDHTREDEEAEHYYELFASVIFFGISYIT